MQEALTQFELLRPGNCSPCVKVKNVAKMEFVEETNKVLV